MTLPFHVNYISGVVLEQNSMLNLSVMQHQHRTTKWLIKIMHVDIETVDRGCFLPLLNAARDGYWYQVRLLLSHEAEQKKFGTVHSRKGLHHTDFEGLNAEGWAQKKGFHDLSVFIQLFLA